MSKPTLKKPNIIGDGTDHVSYGYLISPLGNLLSQYVISESALQNPYVKQLATKFAISEQVAIVRFATYTASNVHTIAENYQNVMLDDAEALRYMRGELS